MQDLQFKSKPVLIGLILAFLFLMAFAQIACAVPPSPAFGIANVDGNTIEWTLDDFFAGMYNGWDASNTLEAKAYLRYDISTDTLYIMVLIQAGYVGLTTPEEAFVTLSFSDDGKIDNKVVSDGSGDNGVPPDFCWVGESGGTAQGYEASFIIGPGNYWIAIHLQVRELTGAPQTAGTDDKTIPLVIPPDHSVPETPITPIVVIAAGAAVFVAVRRVRQKKP